MGQLPPDVFHGRHHQLCAAVVVTLGGRLLTRPTLARSTVISALPSALERFGAIERRVGAGAAVFVDYDGTLTPIVDHPSEAALPEATRGVLARLVEVGPVGVVSGRDLDDVRGMVGLEGLWYAGSHGFDIVEPDGTRHRRATDRLPALERAAEVLEAQAAGTEGAWVERKGFAVALHLREVDDTADLRALEAAIEHLAAGDPGLELSSGKKIRELRPAVDWDKGRAVEWILERIEGSARVPVFVGDDVTDEDVFERIAGRGVAVAVRGEADRPTRADWALADPDEVRRFLERLADLGRP